LSHFLMATRGYAQAEYEAMVEDVKRQVREAIEWAEASPPPSHEELYTDVYTDEWGPYRGTTPPPMMSEGNEGSEGAR
jgi:TPP-dependent pyruvate/acetoin dehydrogenase alpha subunit